MNGPNFMSLFIWLNHYGRIIIIIIWQNNSSPKDYAKRVLSRQNLKNLNSRDPIQWHFCAHAMRCVGVSVKQCPFIVRKKETCKNTTTCMSFKWSSSSFRNSRSESLSHVIRQFDWLTPRTKYTQSTSLNLEFYSCLELVIWGWIELL